MRPNLITRLKEEWNNLDPVDPLRGLIADAIDALAEQQPLTDEQINRLREKHNITSDGRGIKEFTKVCDFARAIEAAHQIGVEK
jgi:hypothetical protein